MFHALIGVFWNVAILVNFFQTQYTGGSTRHGTDGELRGLAVEQGEERLSAVPYVLVVWVGRYMGHQLAHLGPHEINHHGNG